MLWRPTEPYRPSVKRVARLARGVRSGAGYRWSMVLCGLAFLILAVLTVAAVLVSFE
jgi:hypothetical protein